MNLLLSSFMCLRLALCVSPSISQLSASYRMSLTGGSCSDVQASFPETPSSWVWQKIDEGLWEPETFLLFCHLLDGSLYVDVGAHHGATLVYASHFFKRGVAVEPFPEAYHVLTQVSDMNGLGNKVTLHHNCVGSHNGGGYVADDGQAYTDTACIPFHSVLHDAQENKLFVKMDVEGAEQHLIPELVATLQSQSNDINFDETIVYVEVHNTQPVVLETHNADALVDAMLSGWSRVYESLTLLDISTQLKAGRGAALKANCVPRCRLLLSNQDLSAALRDEMRRLRQRMKMEYQAVKKVFHNPTFASTLEVARSMSGEVGEYAKNLEKIAHVCSIMRSYQHSDEEMHPDLGGFVSYHSCEAPLLFSLGRGALQLEDALHSHPSVITQGTDWESVSDALRMILVSRQKVVSGKQLDTDSNEGAGRSEEL